MADNIKESVGVDVALVPGGKGIFEVTVRGRVVAKKDWEGFPSDEAVVEAVRAALEA